MTRRFADADRWKAIRKLSASLKTLYNYAWDMADAAGVYEVDEDYLFIDLGEKYSEKDFEKIPYNLEKIGPGKFLFKNFIEVQYTEIKEGYNPHKPAKRDLEKHGLTLNEKKNQACRKLGFKLEEEGEYKEEGKEEEKGGKGDFSEVEILQEPELEVCPTFDQFWDEYDKKRGEKEKLKRKWQKLRQEEREKIMEYIPNYKLAEPNKQYRKDPDTFFNTKGWNDELIFKNNGTGQQINNQDKRAAFGKYFAGKAG